MGIFRQKIKKKHIQQFAQNIADLLSSELPQLRKAISLSKLYGINFKYKPSGLHLTWGYTPENFEEINRNHKTCFNLTGVSVFNRNSKEYQPLKLFYQSDNLTEIKIVNPKWFHKTFDLSLLQVEALKFEHLEVKNPDKDIALKALKSLSQEQLVLLDLEYTFEIELDEKVFYTILDMEDGNYIAVNKQGKIFRLNHDHEKRVKLIANTPIDFIKLFDGQKSNLEELMYE